MTTRERAIRVRMGSRIRSARIELGIDPASMAREVGSSRRNYSRIESGDLEALSINRLRRICLELGLSLDSLLGLGRYARCDDE